MFGVSPKKLAFNSAKLPLILFPVIFLSEISILSRGICLRGFSVLQVTVYPLKFIGGN